MGHDIGMMGRMRNQAAHNALAKSAPAKDLLSIQPGSAEWETLTQEEKEQIWASRPMSDGPPDIASTPQTPGSRPGTVHLEPERWDPSQPAVTPDDVRVEREGEARDKAFASGNIPVEADVATPRR